MNAIFLQMSSTRKSHNPKMTKTLETNITSDKGEEKSQNITYLLLSNNATIKKDKNSLYLLQYQKYFMKKLVIKYNVLPNEYNLMKLENFIEAKYCHSLARFKELLLFNYDEEFLKRFYSRKEALKKIPLFSEFYKSYLKFFCFPTLAELKLNELIEDMVENKAKAFYNENYSNEKEKSDKKINVVIFTNKIRKDISRRNSLNNLTKTTIKNKSVTNKSSRSIITIERIYNELNRQKINQKINLNSKSEDKILKINFNNNNSHINSGKKIIETIVSKNSVILKKIDYNSNNNNTIKTNNNDIHKHSQRNSKPKNIIKTNSRNIPSKIVDNKSSNINNKKNGQKLKILKSLQKMNTKGIAFKNIFSQHNLNNLNLNNKKVSLEKNSAKASLSKVQTIQNKDIKGKYSYNNSIKLNNKHKANIILVNNNNTKINNNLLKIKSKNYIDNIRFTQPIPSINYIQNINSNNNKILPKRAIQVVKKTQSKKVKSRNHIGIKDVNTINIDSKIHKNDYNPNYYFITSDKNLNSFTKKIQTTQNSIKKTKKIIKTDKKNNVIKKINNIQYNNKRLFNHLNNTKNITNYSESSERKKNQTSLSPSLKNLILKTKGISNYRKNKIINSKIIKHTYVNSYISSDPQRLVKNLKIGNSG
jgi:hypothetical protein